MPDALTWVITGAVAVFALASGAHALLYKRDSRAVIAWVGFIVLLPLAGALLYWLLGVNRIERRATALRFGAGQTPGKHGCPPGQDRAQEDPDPAFAPLTELTTRLSPYPLVGGNHVEPLVNGDEAFPAMLEAIRGAERNIALSTYIFDADPVGEEFAEALATAAARGVEVRVSIDGVGARYSRSSMIRRLRGRGVRCEAFLPVFTPLTIASVNMRNHRKLLVVDGRTGFTGGMNIRAGNRLSANPPHAIQDLQVRIRGPAVAQMLQVFADDWSFVTGESLEGSAWFPVLQSAGDTLVRGIPDGPDEHFDALRLVRQGALAQARERVVIVTPYFLPDAALIAALNGAALRGVEVDILLPAENNLKLVKWASTAQYWQVLERGCRIWETPPPFDHSKLLLVDAAWALLGSANWDPRSLRLNFEFEIECHDPALGAWLGEWAESKRASAREITLAGADGRTLPVRLRDGAARLLTPYL